MKNNPKKIIKKIPLINTVARIISKFLRSFPGSKNYWEQRYAGRGTSGAGSYGKLAEFKAEIINSFIKNNKISIIKVFNPLWWNW